MHWHSRAVNSVEILPSRACAIQTIGAMVSQGRRRIIEAEVADSLRDQRLRTPRQSMELHGPDTTNHLEATKSSCRRLDSLSAYRNGDAGHLPVIENAPLSKAKGRLVIQSHKRADKAGGLLLTDARLHTEQAGFCFFSWQLFWVDKISWFERPVRSLQFKHGETEESLHFNLPSSVHLP